MTALSSGARLGPYEILAPLGAGGMGEVYRARDTRLDREVAVKVLPEETAGSATALSRFEREARAVAALSHPNLVMLLDVGREGGVAYAVLELLEGETLRDLLRGGPPPEARTLSLARELVEGLAAAHGKAIVHRDLKPENVFLTRDGRVKILDFGLAKSAPAPEQVSQAPTHAMVTAEGVSVGTPGYMAPEQVRGQTCDARTDLFAFGAVLYELLTGRRAFRGETSADTLSAVLTAEPDDWTPRTALGEALWGISRRCLRKRPDDRFQSARDLGFALEALRASSARVEAPAGKRSVAVLPFKDLFREAAATHLGLGLADATVTELASIPTLLVRPTASILKYEGRPVEPQEAGRELGVEAVVDGSLQRAGSRLRVTVQLVETASGRSLWGTKIDTSVEDVFAVQDEVSRHIAEALQVRLTGGEPRHAAPHQPRGRAASLYLEGRVRLLRESLTEVDAAICCLRDAVSEDPDFAPALASLADAYVRKAFSYEPRGGWYERAREACGKAIAKNPDLPEARYARARLLWSPEGGFDVTGSLHELATCLRGRPSLNEAWDRLGIMILHVDLFEEAIAAFERAKAIDPEDPEAELHRGLGLHYQGRFEEALAITEDVLPRIPSQWAYYQLAFCQVSVGRVREAAETADFMARHFPSDVLKHSVRALVAALQRDEAGARREVELVVANQKAFGHYHHAQHDVARVFALLGEKAEAIQWLRGAAGNGLPAPRAFETDPLLAPLRGEAGFTGLLAELREICRRHASTYADLFGAFRKGEGETPKGSPRGFRSRV